MRNIAPVFVVIGTWFFVLVGNFFLMGRFWITFCL